MQYSSDKDQKESYSRRKQANDGFSDFATYRTAELNDLLNNKRQDEDKCNHQEDEEGGEEPDGMVARHSCKVDWFVGFLGLGPVRVNSPFWTAGHLIVAGNNCVS